MERTTKKQLEAMAQQVSIETGLPIRLGAWSPGDGKTRYQIELTAPPGYGIETLGRVFLGKTEAYDALRLVRDVIHAMRDGKTYPSPLSE